MLTWDIITDSTNLFNLTIYSGLTQASIRGIAQMHSLPFREKFRQLTVMAAPAANEAQPQGPQVPRVPQHRGKTFTHAPAWAFPVSFSVTRSSQSLPRALSFILCAACGSVVLLYAARVFDYFVVIEIAFMDNQAQITETITRLDSEKVRW